jgi:hypothetical protein
MGSSEEAVQYGVAIPLIHVGYRLLHAGLNWYVCHYDSVGTEHD